jgi:hypothetical protein
MNNKLIPLSTISLMLAITRPAMAANGAEPIIENQLEYAGPTLAVLGIGLLLANHFALGYGWHPREENYRDILRVGQLLFIASAISTIVWIIL